MKIKDVVDRLLKEGRDYKRLPNTSKPTLLKSGAEIIAGVYGYRVACEVMNRVLDTEKNFAFYEVKVALCDEDGAVVAEGVGSCNTRERRYLKTDIAGNLNTVLKMAKKRAYVDAVLTASKASYLFTQDLD